VEKIATPFDLTLLFLMLQSLQFLWMLAASIAISLTYCVLKCTFLTDMVL